MNTKNISTKECLEGIRQMSGHFDMPYRILNKKQQSLSLALMKSFIVTEDWLLWSVS